nr:RNA-directed DNA polymerase, eukaryota, reverse transcriptase zinc-binding domain protein [Tanacetum cinerariifolium]
MDSTKDGVNGKKEVNAGRKSYVVAISENLINSDRNSECIPTQIKENDVEVVVFDDIMVGEGSKRWDLTLCGFFVRYMMSVNELGYNLMRTYSRYGFKDIVDCNNRVFFMKFHHEEGLNQVVCNTPKLGRSGILGPRRVTS